MAFELDDYHRNMSDDELVADLRRVASELGKESVTMEEQNERGRFHAATYFRRFGNWFRALDAAGLQYSRPPMNTPEEDLFRNLEEVWTTLGRQPRYAEFNKPFSKFSVGTYEKRFGSWRKALEAFVVFINTEDWPEAAEKEYPNPGPVSLLQGPRNINWRLRFIVMRRDNFKCKLCGRSPAKDPSIILHVDHVQAWIKGGKTVLENLQTLCSVCNIGKSDLDLDASEVINVAAN
jgi:Homing endonuclease associated repeat/HNH endonuclease